MCGRCLYPSYWLYGGLIMGLALFRAMLGEYAGGLYGPGGGEGAGTLPLYRASTRPRSTTTTVQLSSLLREFTAVHRMVWAMRESGDCAAAWFAADVASVTASCEDMKPKMPSDAMMSTCCPGFLGMHRISGRPEMTWFSCGPCGFAQ